MVASREQSQFSRKRSNTAQSSFKALPTVSPLNLGDTKILHAWVHDVRESHCVIFNHSWWTGVQEGDCLKVSSNDSEDAESGFLFTIPKLEPCPKPQLQVCMKVLCVGEVCLIAQSIDISSAPHCGCLWSTEQRRGHDNESKRVLLGKKQSNYLVFRSTKLVVLPIMLNVFFKTNTSAGTRCGDLASTYLASASTKNKRYLLLGESLPGSQRSSSEGKKYVFTQLQ